jgi:hypothetical protein
MEAAVDHQAFLVASLEQLGIVHPVEVDVENVQEAAEDVREISPDRMNLVSVLGRRSAGPTVR